MATPPVTEAEWLAAENALPKANGVIVHAASALGMPAMTYRHRLMRGRELYNDGRPLAEGRGGYQGGAPDGFLVKGRSTLYDGDGQIRAEWVKTTADMERQQAMVREAVAEMARKLPKLPARPAKGRDYNDALLSFIPWGDPHFGMYAWAEEVGDDFDVDIAKRDLCAAVDILVNQAPPAQRCVIASMGDFYHADNYHGITPASGNILDVDTRLPKVMAVGVAAVRQSIESALRKHAEVTFVPVKGNHDPVLSTALGVMLAHVYEDEPRVTVDTSPAWRHYLRHGKVLLGLAHGDKTKDRDLPGIMATERASDWGEARHRYWHRGHQHQSVRQEFNGCIVEQHQTLAAGDAYAVSHGWLSGRSMQQITYHAEFGEVGRNICSIDMLRAAA